MKKEQQRVYKWLNDDLNLPVFADAYRGALILLSQKSPGHISFIAHFGRDLMNQLASTVKGIKSGRVQYHDYLDKIQNDWQDEWSTRDNLSLEVAEIGHFIPVDLCQKISTLIDEHKQGRLRSSDADGLFFNTFLDYSDKNKIPKHLLLEWKQAKEWFKSHAHLRENPFNSDTEDELVKCFTCLDSYLYIAASSHYERLKDLDEILDTTNN